MYTKREAARDFLVAGSVVTIIFFIGSHIIPERWLNSTLGLIVYASALPLLPFFYIIRWIAPFLGEQTQIGISCFMGAGTLRTGWKYIHDKFGDGTNEPLDAPQILLGFFLSIFVWIFSPNGWMSGATINAGLIIFTLNILSFNLPHLLINGFLVFLFRENSSRVLGILTGMAALILGTLVLPFMGG